METTLSDTREPSIWLVRAFRSAAFVVGVLLVLAVVSLALFYAVGGPFGTLNDGLNLAAGLASVVLVATTIQRGAPPLDLLAGALGILGGTVVSYGAYLVLTDSTGWFLAGVVSGVGGGLIGIWLLVRNRPGSARSRTPTGASHLGRLAGAVMMVGLLGIPGWVSGVDDWAAAPWYVSAAMLSWLGTYVLYPAWSFRQFRLGT
jgi:hypothetical protein